ncbi:hypothetical protein ACFX13_018827 [Malus domestica]
MSQHQARHANFSIEPVPMPSIEISVAISCIGLYYSTLWPANDDTCVQLNYVHLHHNCNYWTKFWNDGILKPSIVLGQPRNVSDYYLDCCNGLILFFNVRTSQFCVFNPITKQHISIPMSVSIFTLPWLLTLLNPTTTELFELITPHNPNPVVPESQRQP